MTYHSLNNSAARFFTTLTALTALVAASPAFSVENRHCLDSPLTNVDTVERGDWIPAGTRSCYRVEVPEQGLLFVEAHAAAMPWISVDSCDGTPVRGFSEVGSKMIVETSAQSLMVCLGAADPRNHLEDYRVDLAFAPSFGTILKSSGDEDDREEEVDPDGLRRTLPSSAPVLKSSGDEDDREQEVDPDGLVTRDAAAMSFDRMCARRLLDDHADTTFCALSVETTNTIDGEIRNDWSDDVDIFALESAGRQVIVIASQGASGLLLEVVDEEGRILGTAQIGQELTQVISKGRYFLRVTGPQGFEGHYSLNIETLR